MKGGICLTERKRTLRRLIPVFCTALLLWLAASPPAMALLPDVYVGGHSIGVLLQTDGVTVVGFSAVTTEQGICSPAEEAGLQQGDFITEINDTQVNSNRQVAEVIETAGKMQQDCVVEFTRKGICHTLSITPQFCTDSQTYRIGLYVRDNTAGVGTLTFWEPTSGVYGALGHAVSALNTQTDTETGTVIRASVEGIRRGDAGNPGEKLGVFLTDEWQGTITTNSSHGIYGIIPGLPTEETMLLPTAEAEEVQEGAAEIRTVLHGETIERFEVNISKTGNVFGLSNHGLVVEVTDERLLNETGGIIQGMSGSPIIQNGKLVGAVTHVFINDPTKGYGVLIEDMLEEAA